jgi:SAM-dependent methyltransferase
MADYAMPRCDEPFDFRRQAPTYARFRPDYAPALYDAIAARSGPGAGRWALDLGCGPGVVAAALARRGWRVVGADFSAPMLAEAERLGAGHGLVQARAEALPLRTGSVALVTCGTAFHWFAPAPTLAEMARVLAPGGWAAIFWQFPAPGDPTMALLRSVLDDLGLAAPEVLFAPPAPASPFEGSTFAAEPPLLFAAEYAFSAEALVGWVGTLEWVRRVAGAQHAQVLAALRTALATRHPGGLVQQTHQHLFLGRLPGPRAIF